MNINGHTNGSSHVEKSHQGMKRLQIIALSAGIFAITGFGISEWENVFHKANTYGLLRNIQISWNRSIAETNKEWTAIWTGPQWETRRGREEREALWAKVKKDVFAAPIHTAAATPTPVIISEDELRSMGASPLATPKPADIPGGYWVESDNPQIGWHWIKGSPSSNNGRFTDK